MTKTTEHIILKTENLAIGYQTKKQQKVIQNNINLNIKKGELVAVLGKNGIGKSTLLRTLSNVQKPIDGSVFINQKNSNNYTNKELAQTLSLVLTERLPESQLTVYELIALGRQPYTNWVDRISDNDKSIIDKAIALTEISAFTNRRFYELSDGQLQRVLIARAIAQDTDIIILDEPSAHLDIHHTVKLFSVMKKLVEETGKTILISSHEVNLAVKFANTFIVLTDDGVESGTLNQLKNTTTFNNLFPKDLIYFDNELQQFLIKKE